MYQMRFGKVYVPFKNTHTCYLISKKGIKELKHDTKYILKLNIHERYVLLIEAPDVQCFKSAFIVGGYLSVIEFEKTKYGVELKSTFWSKYQGASDEVREGKPMDADKIRRILYNVGKKNSHKLIAYDERVDYVNFGSKKYGSEFIKFDDYALEKLYESEKERQEMDRRYSEAVKKLYIHTSFDELNDEQAENNTVFGSEDSQQTLLDLSQEKITYLVNVINSLIANDNGILKNALKVMYNKNLFYKIDVFNEALDEFIRISISHGWISEYIDFDNDAILKAFVSAVNDVRLLDMFLPLSNEKFFTRVLACTDNADLISQLLIKKECNEFLNQGIVVDIEDEQGIDPSIEWNEDDQLAMKYLEREIDEAVDADFADDLSESSSVESEKLSYYSIGRKPVLICVSRSGYIKLTEFDIRYLDGQFWFVRLKEVKVF